MEIKSLLIILFVILLLGCQSRHNTQSLETTASDAVIKTTQKSNNSATNAETKENSEETDSSNILDCTRAQATAILKKSVYPNAVFRLNSDHQTGTETLDLPNGDKLTIYNQGCEYFELTFRFETFRFQADTTNIKYWLQKTVLLMNEIEPGIDCPLDIKGGIMAIQYTLADTSAYQLGGEINYGDVESMNEFVTLNRIRKISADNYGIEASFVLGPL